MKPPLLEGETWDDLLRGGMGVIQSQAGYRFAMDSVLLAHFAAQLPARQVLDLGAGCGVISFLLAARLPESKITGLEIQEEQVMRARRSADFNRVRDRVTFLHGDLRDRNAFAAGSFDLVVMNPPFYPAGQGRVPANQETALSRHEISCTLSDVFKSAGRWIKSDGRLCLVLPPFRLEEAVEIAVEQRFKLSRLRNVHPRADRPANLILMEFTRNRRGAVIMPPLFVYTAGGDYTDEIKSIYFD